MKYASVGPIAIHLPAARETNEQLAVQFPHWNMQLIESKTGIATRHVAAGEELPSDLAVAAAEKLFRDGGVDRRSIDFLLLCTQTPDYPLPTTACLVQQRLGLATSIGALDFNLGCSGFVYGLSLGDGLIRSGSARRVLLITAETYSKYIAAEDRSLRTVFGDGAAATVIEAADEPSLGPFVFGTDGRGGSSLMVTRGGQRIGGRALQPPTRHRWPSALYMNGPGIVNMTLETIPRLVDQVLERAGLAREDVQLFLMHQATSYMLEKLRDWLELEPDRLPIELRDYGNTVSSTLPILMHQLRGDGRLRPGTRALLIGFGVGYSWAGCAWTETWAASGALAADQATPRDAA